MEAIEIKLKSSFGDEIILKKEKNDISGEIIVVSINGNKIPLIYSDYLKIKDLIENEMGF